MLIDLPSVHEYSMADCRDLFVSRLEDDFEISASGVSKSNERPAAPHYSGVRGMPGDALAEPFTYTSSSDSDADVYFSDIEVSRGPPLNERTDSRIQPGMSASAKKLDQELALHSPGQLLGTPRDPSRRYEYPFPAHLRVGDADLSDETLSGSSTATTPGLSPGESSFLGLASLASPPTGIASHATNLPIYLREASSAPTPPAPIPVPVPVPVSSPFAVPATSTSISTSLAAKVSNTLLAPLSQVLPVSGPSSAPVIGANTTNINTTTSIAAHPKLSRFNPADAPIPPGLRSRTRVRRSTSVSVPGNQALQPAQNMQAVPVLSVVATAKSAPSIPTIPTSVGGS